MCQTGFLRGIGIGIGGAVLLAFLRFLYRFRNRSRVSPQIVDDSIEDAYAADPKSDDEQSTDKEGSVEADSKYQAQLNAAVKWFGTRMIIDPLRIVAIILCLVRLSPIIVDDFRINSANASSSSDDMPLTLFVVPLALWDVVVVVVLVFMWKRDNFWAEQRHALLIYSFLFGFPCGTTTKVLSSLYYDSRNLNDTQYANAKLPDYALFIPLVTPFVIIVSAIFLFFFCTRHHSRKEDWKKSCKSRPNSNCVIILACVVALLYYFCVTAVALLQYLWPNTVTLSDFATRGQSYLVNSWAGRLMPLWIILIVFFSGALIRLTDLMTKGMFLRAERMVPDLLLFCGYSIFALLLTYDADCKSLSVSVIYVPVIVAEVLSLVCITGAVVRPYCKIRQLLKHQQSLRGDVDYQRLENWTPEAVALWLRESVKLSQYSKKVLEKKVNGATLKSMSRHEIDNLLGIDNLLHQKVIQFHLFLRKESSEAWDEKQSEWANMPLTTRDNVTGLDVTDLKDYWLDSLGLGHLQEKFNACHIDGIALHLLSVSDITEEDSLAAASSTEAYSLLSGQSLLKRCHYDMRLLKQCRNATQSSGYLIFWTNNDVKTRLTVGITKRTSDALRGLHGAYLLEEQCNFDELTQALTAGQSYQESNRRDYLRYTLTERMLAACEEMANEIKELELVTKGQGAEASSSSVKEASDDFAPYQAILLAYKEQCELKIDELQHLSDELTRLLNENQLQEEETKL